MEIICKKSKFDFTLECYQSDITAVFGFGYDYNNYTGLKTKELSIFLAFAKRQIKFQFKKMKS